MNMGDKRVAIVTGGSSGIGLDVTRKLVKQGYHCIIASRNLDNINNAISDLNLEGWDNVEGMVLDLCDLSSVHQFVSDFKSKNLPLHILINNIHAGIYTPTKRVNNIGIESTFCTNHLGHFLLTNLLLDKLKDSAPSKIVVVSSSLHDSKKRGGKDVPIKEYNFDNTEYTAEAAYRFSKLSNLWFTYKLNRLLEGTGVVVNAVSPGFIPQTNLSRDYNFIFRYIGSFVLSFMPFTRTIDYGSESVISLTKKEITEGGKYYHYGEATQSSERSYNIEEQEEMWKLSLKLVSDYLRE